MLIDEIHITGVHHVVDLKDLEQIMGKQKRPVEFQSIISKPGMLWKVIEIDFS